MLKHVQISPMRQRCDTLSIRSSISSTSSMSSASSSSSCASSMCGSPEPELASGATGASTVPASMSMRASCRVSSYSSLADLQPQTTVKIFTACLRIDIEYKTLGIQWNTTSKDVVGQLLRRCKIRQRDPRLFFLCMKISVRRAGVKTLLILDDDASPAILQACYPKGDTQFYLQMRPGGLIRVQTGVLQPASQYKSMLIAEETTSDELLQLLLLSYKSSEPVERFSVYEVSADQEYQRKLHPDDRPLRAQQQRAQRGEACQFLVRENPQYPLSSAAFLRDAADIDRLLCVGKQQQQHPDDGGELDTTVVAETSRSTSVGPDASHASATTESIPLAHARMSTGLCNMCKYTFKTCEFCHKSEQRGQQKQQLPPQQQPPQQQRGKSVKSLAYCPVYNIREIRTMRQSAFASSPVLTGSDRKRFTFGRPCALTESTAGGVAI